MRIFHQVVGAVRRAVETYLAGISPEYLRLLEAGTRKAERHFADMANELDRVNARLDAAFVQLDRQHRNARQRSPHGNEL